MPIKLHPKAEIDVEEALQYYEQVDKTLKLKFIHYLETTFNKIQQKDNSIQYELYEIMKITWLLDDRKGDRYLYNRLQTNSAESLGFKGLKSFLNNEFDKIHF